MSRSAQGPSIAIVGGGIGGVAAAAFLLRAGVHDVTVFEQAEDLHEVGAGLQLGPNVTRLLSRLGLDPQLASEAVRLETGWELRRWADGSVLSRQRLGDACVERFGAPYYVVHRARLLEWLAALLPKNVLALGHRCVGFAAESDGVTLSFANGTEVTADAVIGADGIHSLMRSGVVAADPPSFSGLAAYRCVVDGDRAPAQTRRPVFSSWLGPRRHLVHYLLSARGDVNVVAVVPAGEWREESWTAQGSADELRREFDGWDPTITKLLAGVSEAQLYALYDREPTPRWTDGRIALLGDAAHPMLPFFAQGAGQAIEDGAVLALCLVNVGSDQIPGALARYEAIRRERASRVQAASRGRPGINHLPDGHEQRERDEGFRASDPMRAQAWVYEHDAEASVRPNRPTRRSPRSRRESSSSLHASRSQLERSSE